jgi:mRNA interferase RelE/StbE
VYRLEITRAAARQLDRIERPTAIRLEAAIRTLAQNPRPAGCAKLAGRDNTWRIRVGDYRVVYEIHDDVLVVVVIRVAHRREVYR